MSQRISELSRGCSLYTETFKGHNSVKMNTELWHLFCPHCLMLFYICTKFCRSIALSFRVTDLNNRVDARVVANVDGRTDGRTNGRKTGSLYRAMPEAGVTKNDNMRLAQVLRLPLRLILV